MGKVNSIHNTRLSTAARNFWDDVAHHRTVCIGGNVAEQRNGDKTGRLDDAPDGSITYTHIGGEPKTAYRLAAGIVIRQENGPTNLDAT